MLLVRLLYRNYILQSRYTVCICNFHNLGPAETAQDASGCLNLIKMLHTVSFALFPVCSKRGSADTERYRLTAVITIKNWSRVVTGNDNRVLHVFTLIIRVRTIPQTYPLT